MNLNDKKLCATCAHIHDGLDKDPCKSCLELFAIQFKQGTIDVNRPMHKYEPKR